MKRIVLLLSLFTLLTPLTNAQPNSIGKKEVMVIWDLLGRDTITQPVYRSFYCRKWNEGDTMVLSVERIEPDCPLYHPLYYFVDDICVKQRVIYLKEHTWPIGTISMTVDRVAEYNLNDDFPANYPSSYYQNSLQPVMSTIANDNIPGTKPQK